jgi:replicative DNA helicase
MAERTLRIIERAAPAPKSPDGRLPPQALDAEAAVLSACLLEPGGNLVRQLKERLPAEAFANEANQRLWRALGEMAEASRLIDVVTVAGYLRSKVNDQGVEHLRLIGGTHYLGELVAGEMATPVVANVRDHAEMVRELWVRRREITHHWKCLGDLYGPLEEYPSWTEARAAEHQALALEASPARIVVGTASAQGAKDKIRARRSGGMLGTPTGLATIDEHTGGLHPGDLVFVSADAKQVGGTKGGKTALALTMAVNVCQRSVDQGGGAVGYWDLELGKAEIWTRIGCAFGRVNWHALRRNVAVDEDYERLEGGIDQASRLPLFIDELTGPSGRELGGAIRRAHAYFARTPTPMRVAIIDWVQQVDASDIAPPKATTEQQMRKLAFGLVRLAKELGIAIVAVAATNDDGKIRDCHGMPYLGTAWWSVKIDAKDKPGPREACVTVNVQRHGPWPRTCAMWFHPAICWFSDDQV